MNGSADNASIVRVNDFVRFQIVAARQIDGQISDQDQRDFGLNDFELGSQTGAEFGSGRRSWALVVEHANGDLEGGVRFEFFHQVVELGWGKVLDLSDERRLEFQAKSLRFYTVQRGFTYLCNIRHGEKWIFIVSKRACDTLNNISSISCN